MSDRLVIAIVTLVATIAFAAGVWLLRDARRQG